MNSTSALQDTFKSDREKFLDTLSSFVILDIGTIMGTSDEGRARVVSSTFINDKPVIYEDAEIIFPGNANGTYAAQCAGMSCLIFIPRSCMPKVSDLKLHIGATSYNRSGVKALPIGNGVANNVKTLFSENGRFDIFGQLYSIEFAEDSITYSMNDGVTSVTIDGSGQVYLTRQVDSGTYSKSIEDGGVTTTWLSQDKDVLWTDKYNPDGSRSFVQSDPDDESSDPLFSMNIAADGTVTINTAVDISLATKGGTSVSIDGDATVSAKGDVSISSQGDVVLEATGTGTLDIKNSIASLGGMIDDLFTELTSSTPVTYGSPASHMWMPSFVAKITAIKTKWAQVFK